MQLTKQELYSKIFDKVENNSKTNKTTALKYANSIGIGRTNFYIIQKYAKSKDKNLDIHILSTPRLKEICNKLGFIIEREIFELSEKV